MKAGSRLVLMGLGLLSASAMLLVAQERRGQTADEVLAEYLGVVQREMGKDPQALGLNEALRRLHDVGEKHLLKNKAILHKRAAAEYLKLEVLTTVKIEDQERIAWDSADNYRTGNAISAPDAAKNKLGSFITIFIDGGYGIPPYGKETRATTWWNPLTAATALRLLALNSLESETAFGRRQAVDSLAPPMVYRLSPDAERPSIAFFDGHEIFVVDLKYTEVGIYSLEGIRWVRLKVGVPATRPASDAP